MTKTSFVLHKDSLDILDQLTDNQAGRLFKAISSYQKTGGISNLDQLLTMVITPFLNQFTRDDEKYKKSEVNGKLGNLKQYHKEIYNKFIAGEVSLEEAETLAYPHKKYKTSGAIGGDQVGSLSDSVSVSVSVNDNVNKYTFFQFQVAQQLGTHIESTKNISLKQGDIKRWANDIRLLQQVDLKPRGVAQSTTDIETAMQAITEYSNTEFFPVVESGGAFRKKFSKIENFLNPKKAKTKEVKIKELTPEEKKRLRYAMAKSELAKKLRTNPANLTEKQINSIIVGNIVNEN